MLAGAWWWSLYQQLYLPQKWSITEWTQQVQSIEALLEQHYRDVCTSHTLWESNDLPTLTWLTWWHRARVHHLRPRSITKAVRLPPQLSHTADTCRQDHLIVALIGNINHEGGGCFSLCIIDGLLYSASYWPILHLVVGDVWLNIGLSVTGNGWPAHTDCLVVCLFGTDIFRRHSCGCKVHREEWHNTQLAMCQLQKHYTCSGLSAHTRTHAHTCTHSHIHIHSSQWRVARQWQLNSMSAIHYSTS